MKKIFNLLAIVTLVVTGASDVIACNSNQQNFIFLNRSFNPLNFNTWGTRQIWSVRNKYIEGFQNWYKPPSAEGTGDHWGWYDWSNWVAYQVIESAVNSIIEVPYHGDGWNYTYQPNPDPGKVHDTKAVLAKGLYLVIKPAGPKSSFRGELKVYLQL